MSSTADTERRKMELIFSVPDDIKAEECTMVMRPNLDARIVRCRDCRHGSFQSDEPYSTAYYCGYDGSRWHDADYFCRDGETKDKERTLEEIRERYYRVLKAMEERREDV